MAMRPWRSFFKASDGTLYCTTYTGGASGAGSIMSVNLLLTLIAYFVVLTVLQVDCPMETLCRIPVGIFIVLPTAVELLMEVLFSGMTL